MRTHSVHRESCVVVSFRARTKRCHCNASDKTRYHELNKIDFEIIEDAFKALLQSHPDPVKTDKIVDLQNMFRDAYTGWLESEQAAA
jgi:hypothetical protein